METIINKDLDLIKQEQQRLEQERLEQQRLEQETYS
jgi:hypothetical protein